MNTLTAFRQWQSAYNCVTTLRDCNGFVKAILTGYQQPTKKTKTIVVRSKTYNLEFN